MILKVTTKPNKITLKREVFKINVKTGSGPQGIRGKGVPLGGTAN